MNLHTFHGLRAFFSPTLNQGDDWARPQADALRELLEYVRRSLSNQLSIDDARSFLHWADSQIEVVSAADASIPMSRQRFVDGQILSQFIATPDRGDFYIDAIAAFMCEFEGYMEPSFRVAAEKEKLHRAVTQYTALLATDSAEKKWAPEELATLRSQMESALRGAQNRLQEISEQVIKTQKQDIDFKEMLLAQVDDARQTLEQLRNQASQSNSVVLGAEQKAVEFNARIEPIEKNFESFVSAIESRFQISATMKLWQQRATANAVAFVLSALFLFALFAGPAGIVAWKYKALSHAVQEALIIPKAAPAVVTSDTSIEGKSDSMALNAVAPAVDELNTVELIALTLNRAILLLFPLALYIWLIRLVVRFNSRSMLLMDDARIRQAMMDTFYRLATDQTLKDDERKLMLEALYRPAPGHSDGPDFPNVIELVNKIPRP